VLTVDVFVEGEYIDVVGTSKGKGFQGVVKRHGFRGVNDATHGQHNMRMAGRMGGDRVKMINLQVMKIIPEKNLIVVKGSVPGPNNSLVIIERWS